MGNCSQVRYWIDELPKIGKTTFSLKEAEDKFRNKPAASVRRALARLSETGKIRSVWKGFYAISLPEYGINGIVPPMDYIDQLMRHLGIGYYIALLTAASYNGASHHALQRFQVICDSILHVKDKHGVIIEPAYKKVIPCKYVGKINSRTASVEISTPELTSVDLFLYRKRAGGINQITTVLAELAESMDFRRVDADFFAGVPATVVQRLGYVLDDELEEKALAENLYDKAKLSGVRFKPISLITDADNRFAIIKKSKKWEMAVNYKIEADL